LQREKLYSTPVRKILEKILKNFREKSTVARRDKTSMFLKVFRETILEKNTHLSLTTSRVGHFAG
jgi:hypothetical protein